MDIWIFAVFLFLRLSAESNENNTLQALEKHTFFQHEAVCVPPTLKYNEYLQHHQGGYQIINKVCFEGGVIVVHDSEILDKMGAEQGRGLPYFDSNKFQEHHKHATYHADPLLPIEGGNCRHGDLRIRYPTSSEVKKSKHFSQCTLPVLIYSNWIHTYGEYFTRVPWITQLQETGNIDKNATFIFASCNSIPLEPYHMILVKPFTNHNVYSWSAFAGKVGANNDPSITGGQDAGHMRCYDKMLILGFDHARWAHTYRIAQHVLDYYNKLGKVPNSTLFTSGPDTLKIFFEYRSVGGKDEGGHFAKRVGPKMQIVKPDDPRLQQYKEYIREPEKYKGKPMYAGARQILNLGEILQLCETSTNWPEVLKGTKWKGVECRVFSFGKDMFEAMSVMQQVDLFISLHGSGEINSMFMREGTIKIQMRQKEFGTVHRYLSNGYWPLMCHQNDFPFQCWFLNFDEEDSFEPGLLERLGLMEDQLIYRDRHLRLNFEHLQYALKEILPVQENKKEYLRRWEESQVAITFFSNHTVGYFQHISR
ncbi:hypothetical protein CEUSTIGMA_g2004.t1 [Chlamydomonas eustigma]|uniref:Glycosyltransferase 61 catalytic domain-containing protein n=1 Tax=Chlamydomonas eustigma TaxID=1157962 RepID=A0A250WUP6_9CHLO|nr:hypothetical protein CEUSTIGMA_g2004.t1 [Chlamydomonas eustigma]|eukprot:GAX74554.1 hypothetical protein CEUSTIGMA_g2004.t1 [Chlamydomonas eustigma]